MSKPYSKVIQLVKHSQDGGDIDTVTLVALCEDGSIWYFYPALKNQWEQITEMDGGKYV